MNPHLYAECERLVKAVAPELDCYIVSCADLQLGSADCYGFALTAVRSHFLRDVLGDQWQGPKQVLAIDVYRTQRDSWGDWKKLVLQVAVHEAAHLVEMQPFERPVVDLPPTPKFYEYQRDTLVADLNEDHTYEIGRSWDSHGPTHIQLALQLWKKATEAGWDIPLRGLVSPGLISLHEERYLPLVDDYHAIRAEWEADVARFKRLMGMGGDK